MVDQMPTRREHGDCRANCRAAPVRGTADLLGSLRADQSARASLRRAYPPRQTDVAGTDQVGRSGRCMPEVGRGRSGHLCFVGPRRAQPLTAATADRGRKQKPPVCCLRLAWLLVCLERSQNGSLARHHGGRAARARRARAALRGPRRRGASDTGSLCPSYAAQAALGASDTAPRHHQRGTPRDSSCGERTQPALTCLRGRSRIGSGSCRSPRCWRPTSLAVRPSNRPAVGKASVRQRAERRPIPRRGTPLGRHQSEASSAIPP